MYVMPLLGLILLIVSFFAAKQVPGARKWAGIVFGLIVLQVALALRRVRRRPGRSAPCTASTRCAIFGRAVRASMLTREAGHRPAASVPRQRPRQSIGSSAPEASRPVGS